MSDEWEAPEPLAPWPTLAEREAGEVVKAELFEDVPPHLERNLRNWVFKAVKREDGLVRKVLSRFRVSWINSENGRERTQLGVLSAIMEDKTQGISSSRPLDRLSIVDAIVALHPAWLPEEELARETGLETYELGRYFEEVAEQFRLLADLLLDAGSAWRLDLELRGLHRRVNPAATDAWRQARETADKTGNVAASTNLAVAWHEIYGRSPDPTAGYAAAVKAVEAVAVPVLAPGTGKTVHAAARMLRSDLDKDPDSWQFALLHNKELPPGAGRADIVLAMLERLLRGETGRHTSGEHNRDSTQAEAQAAVHLAVVLVQWFSDGAVGRRP